MRHLAVTTLLALGCATLPAPPDALPAGGLPRVYLVSPGIYRGPQPDGAQFAALVRLYGIKSVLKLNSALEAHDVVPTGVEIIHHPWLPAGPVIAEEIAATCDDLASAPRPIYVHCQHGEDRTGAAIGVCVRKRMENASPTAIWGEARRYGFHDGVVNKPGLPALVESFEREIGEMP